MPTDASTSPDSLTLDVPALDGYRYDGVSLGVVGFPIRHSLSPVMHMAALRQMARENPDYHNWVYHRIEAAPEHLKKVIEVCGERGFRGLNLTIPHKVEVIPFLDEVDAGALRMEAVNTVLFDSGRVCGFNTDGIGMVAAVSEGLGSPIRGEDVVLIGAGGAARAAAVQCLELGCRSLWVGNRSSDRLEALLDSLRSNCPEAGVHGFLTGMKVPEVPAGSLLIHATSVGLKNEEVLPVSPQLLGRMAAVFDMVYCPDGTRLVRTAREMGLKACDGLGMLVHQGAKALELWTGIEVPVETMKQAVMQAVDRKDERS